MLTCEIRDTEGKALCGLMFEYSPTSGNYICIHASHGYEYLRNAAMSYTELWCKRRDYELVILEDDANAD